MNRVSVFIFGMGIGYLLTVIMFTLFPEMGR